MGLWLVETLTRARPGLASASHIRQSPRTGGTGGASIGDIAAVVYCVASGLDSVGLCRFVDFLDTSYSYDS
jgi:hypothetical protein